MSLSTLLEAAKYLDYLDSNPQQGQQHEQSIQLHMQKQTQSQQQFHKALPTSAKRSTRRQRSSKKDAANTMVAMSLPATTGAIQMQHGVPIPLASVSGTHGAHHHASLSSSFTTESPLSSFASTALLCSKASGVTSASSSAESSLSSSDSSSSCGEILMEDNDFNQSTSISASTGGRRNTNQKQKTSSQRHTHQQSNNNNNIEINNHLQNLANNQSAMMYKFSPGSYNDRGQSFARYIAATSTGPQLVTMTTAASGGVTSASAPIDGRIRAGHVIHAATQNTSVCTTAGGNYDSRFSIGSLHGRDNQATFGMAGSLSSDNQLSSSSGSCPTMIMARVQPMILNSISPSAHQNLVAFQPTHVAASSSPSSSSSYSRHRELHKTLEKNRRAHLRHCFELLKSELPVSECVDKKTSHINIIKSAIRYVLALRQQECEIDNELQRLTKIKNELTDKLSTMRNIDDHQRTNHLQLWQSSQEISSLSSIAPNQPAKASSTAAPLASSPPTEQSSPNANPTNSEHLRQQPAAEQQLSFLLSQSKID